MARVPRVSAANPRGITVTRVGNWGRLFSIGRKLGKVAPKVSAFLFAEAKNTERIIKQKIKAQSYDWQPLSPRWLEVKQAEGQDKRTLIGWGDYLDAIRVLPAGPGAWMVGVPKNATNREGKSLAMIGIVHEFGDTKGKYNVPARPFWQEEYENSRQRVTAGLLAIGIEVLR